jgi:secretory carrier-associated membrane protein
LQGKTTKASKAPTDKNLAAREAALAKREADVRRREAALAQRGGAAIDPMLVKNFPSCCPMVHHDIANDIPSYNKNIMRAYAPPHSL